MALVQTSDLAESVVTQYDKDFLFFADEQAVWANLLYLHMRKKEGIGRAMKGKTVQIPIYTRVPALTDHLTESSDVTPISYADSSVSVTLYEEGNVMQVTRLTGIASYVDLGKIIAKALAINFSERRDKILRDAIVFNVTDTIYGGTATSRVTCDTTNDIISYAKIVEAYHRAKSRGVPTLPDGTYFCPCNEAVMTELTALDQWKYPAFYCNPEIIVHGDFSSIEKGRLPGEIGMLYKVRFVPHPWGKLFLGAGTAAQAATTIDTGGIAAGGTTLNVVSATGIAAGDWITVGTLEASSTAYPTTEQMLVTAVATNALTVRGAGAEGNPSPTEWGAKFAHAAGVSVIEAANVAALPILGPESAVIAFAEDVGWAGEQMVHDAPTQLAGRFQNHQWYWVGGAAIVNKNCVQIECATAGRVLGNN